MRSILVAAIALFGLVATPALAQPAVSLTAKVRAKTLRLEVVGPPRAAFAVLVASAARGGFFLGHPVDVEYLHPVENVIGGGELDAEGRGAVEVPCRASDLRGMQEAYLQAVAFEPGDVRRVFGASGVLRFRPGPPPEVQPWRRLPWRGGLVLLVVVGSALVGIVGRRRGADLRRRFSAAATALVIVGICTLPEWPRLIPIAFARHGMAQARVDAHILGDDLAAAVAAVSAHAAGVEAIRVVRPRDGRYVAPRVLQYYLYPLRLLHDAAAVGAARRGGATVLLLRALDEKSPPPVGFAPVTGFRAPGFRLFRAGERGRP